MPEIDAQYRELREGAGLLDRAGRATLEVTGSDAAEFLIDYLRATPDGAGHRTANDAPR